MVWNKTLMSSKEVLFQTEYIQQCTYRVHTEKSIPKYCSILPNLVCYYNFSYWFATNRNFIWCKLNQKRGITFEIWFNLKRFWNWILSVYATSDCSLLKRCKTHTEKSFRYPIKSNRNQIVFTTFRLIWNQTDVRLVL